MCMHYAYYNKPLRAYISQYKLRTKLERIQQVFIGAERAQNRFIDCGAIKLYYILDYIYVLCVHVV